MSAAWCCRTWSRGVGPHKAAPEQPVQILSGERLVFKERSLIPSVLFY